MRTRAHGWSAILATGWDPCSDFLAHRLKLGETRIGFLSCLAIPSPIAKFANSKLTLADKVSEPVHGAFNA